MAKNIVSCTEVGVVASRLRGSSPNIVFQKGACEGGKLSLQSGGLQTMLTVPYGKVWKLCKLCMLPRISLSEAAHSLASRILTLLALPRWSKVDR